MSDLIELAGVRKSYRRGSEVVKAVDGVSFSVAPGEFVAIVGPSGSGKTTLMNLIGCMERPDAGSVRIDGEETGRLSEGALTRIRSRKIGFVFQQFFLLPTLTAEENVELPTVFAGRSDGAARARDLLARVGLEGRARHRPSQLSGGEMQRVAIARALMNEPKIVLADEPTGNLDSRSTADILAILRELNAGGLTVLTVTHNEDLARAASRGIRLRDGREETGRLDHGKKEEE